MAASERVVRVWLVPLPGDERDVAGSASLLDDEERARAARLRRPADRARYIGAHAARRRLLGGALGIAPASLTFGRDPCPLCGDPHGRPHVTGVERPISLSHTTGLAALALAPAGVAVGIDVEATHRRVRAADLDAALHPGEAAAIAGLPADARAPAALRTWVRKEAYLKGTGTGLGVDPTTVEVGAAPGWTVTDIDAGPDHRCALAVASDLALPIDLADLRSGRRQVHGDGFHHGAEPAPSVCQSGSGVSSISCVHPSGTHRCADSLESTTIRRSIDSRGRGPSRGPGR